MPPIEKGIGPDNASPSTLIDVLGQVRDAFDAAGDATTILIGAQYLEQFGVGHGPRVLFVDEPEGGGGAIEGAASLGNPASQVHACNVYVRADEETDDDLTRRNLLYKLNDRVVSFVQTATTGKLTFGPCSDNSPIKSSSSMGAGLAWSFTYRREIRHDVDRWRAQPRNRAGDPLTGPMTSPPDASPPVLQTSPAAVLGSVGTVSITVTTEEES